MLPVRCQSLLRASDWSYLEEQKLQSPISQVYNLRKQEGDNREGGKYAEDQHKQKTFIFFLKLNKKCNDPLLDLKAMACRELTVPGFNTEDLQQEFPQLLLKSNILFSNY